MTHVERCVRVRRIVLRFTTYTGKQAAEGPQTNPWRRVGWGRFLVGGAGVWLDLWPREMMLSLEWRPVDSDDVYEWDMSRTLQAQTWRHR